MRGAMPAPAKLITKRILLVTAKITHLGDVPLPCRGLSFQSQRDVEKSENGKTTERGEQMNFYEHELAKQRMTDVIRSREQEHLARELHLASRGPRKSLAVRSVAFVLALFRV